MTRLILLQRAQVVSKPEYQAWAATFGDKITHLYVNAAATGGSPVLLSSRAMQARLNALNQSVFPLQYSDQVGGEPALQEKLPEAAGHHVKALPGQNLLKLVLRPLAKQGLCYGACARVLQHGIVIADGELVLQGGKVGREGKGAERAGTDRVSILHQIPAVQYCRKLFVLPANYVGVLYEPRTMYRHVSRGTTYRNCVSPLVSRKVAAVFPSSRL